MKVIGILLLLILFYVIWQYFELKKFRVTPYQYRTKKVQGSLHLAVLADLHAHVYGKDNDLSLIHI